MFKEYKNLLPKEACQYLIEYASKSPSNNILSHSNTTTVQAQYLMKNKPFVQILFYLTQVATKEYGKVLFPELVEIVKWPIDSYQPPHIDTTRESTKYTSVTYLNLDYEGGKTFFTKNNKKSINEIGTTIFFDGVQHEHGVEKITKGTRYTLPIWYSDNINDFILNW